MFKKVNDCKSILKMCETRVFVVQLNFCFDYVALVHLLITIYYCKNTSDGSKMVRIKHFGAQIIYLKPVEGLQQFNNYR